MRQKLPSEKFYTRVFVVEGKNDFPFDMLRYECCFPATEIEANKLGKREPRQIKLVQRSRTYALNRARWQSFGWDIVKENENE